MTSTVRIKKGARISIPTYESLGVKTLINCQGTYTVLGGSLPLPEVLKAEKEASRHYVRLDELAEAAGAWIAELTGAPWGLVTCGSAAALCQLTAACIAGSDPERMVRLPDTGDLSNRVLTLSWHRHEFEHAIRMAGARIVAVDTKQELEREAGKGACMLAFLGEVSGEGNVSLAEMAEIGRSRSIPLVVDAAAERPDRPNRYLAGGADAVIYSGGKCLRGPQNTGLVLGRRDLLEAAYLHGNPHIGLARPMKVSKESLMGLLAALSMWYQRDHKHEWTLWEGMLRAIASRISSVPGIRTEIRLPERPSNVAPVLSIQWERRLVPVSNREVKKKLAEGEPGIEMPLSGHGLSVMPYMMEAGEERIVGRKLREIFDNALALKKPGMPGPGERAGAIKQGELADVSGAWNIDLQFVLGKSTHRMVLQQEGGLLQGRYTGSLGESELTGEVQVSSLTFHTVLRYEAKDLRYAFKGTVERQALRGSVSLAGFGEGSWHATRQ